jgi:hypothetical protein
VGLFSSLFARRTPQQASSRSDRLTDLCIEIRQEMGFLDYYLSNRTEKPADLMRFHFSKDVLMILLSSASVMTSIVDHQEFMQFNERVRSRYLRRLPVPPTSLVGDCLVCEDELEAISRFVAPNASLSQIRTTPVSTIGLISLTVDYRASEFRNDFVDGFSQSESGFGHFQPAARTFLSRVRGVPADSISFDDIVYLSTAIIMPFHALALEVSGW